MWNYKHTIPNDELFHYGVKGMKWGVRRARKQVDKINKQINRLDEVSKRIDRHGKNADVAITKQQKLQEKRFKNGDPSKMSKQEKDLFETYKQNVKELNKAVKEGDKLALDIQKRSDKADKLLKKYSNVKVVARKTQDGGIYIDFVED